MIDERKLVEQIAESIRQSRRWKSKSYAEDYEIPRVLPVDINDYVPELEEAVGKYSGDGVRIFVLNKSTNNMEEFFLELKRVSTSTK